MDGESDEDVEEGREEGEDEECQEEELNGWGVEVHLI